MRNKKKIALAVTAAAVLILALSVFGAIKTSITRSRVSFSSESVTVRLGDTVFLPGLLDGSARELGKDVSFSCADTGIARVSEATLSGLSEGRTTLTARYKGAACSTVTLTVRAVPVLAFSFEAQEATLFIGREIRPVIVSEPADATDAVFELISSDTSVAAVSGPRVTGVSQGEATITAVHPRGTASIIIRVLPVAPESLAIAASPMFPGDTQPIAAVFSPSDTTDQTIAWTSSDPKVIRVENGNATAVAPGRAVITARHSSGVQAQAEMEVLDVLPLEVRLSCPNPSAYAKSTLFLDASFAPENVTQKSLVWSSSDETVATVSSGLVRCVSAGRALITATAVNGVSSEFEVVVKGNSRVMDVSVFEDCDDTNHVGNEWDFTHKLNSKVLPGYSNQVTLTRGGRITLYTKVVEEDKIPDAGSNSKTVTVSDRDFENGFTVSFKVTVRENRGRYKGNTAVWVITYTFEPADD